MSLPTRAVPLLIALAILLSGAAFALGSDSRGIPWNIPQSVTGPDATCKTITNQNSTGLSEYVPTSTTAEWQSFIAHPPAGVSLATCAPLCAGKLIGGYCWYLGAAPGSSGQNCTTVCASHGGCNVQGLNNYVGYLGTNAQCREVLNALGAPLDSVTEYGPGVNQVGAQCAYLAPLPGYGSYPGWPAQRVHWTNTPSTNSCGGPNNYYNMYAACSCNN